MKPFYLTIINNFIIIIKERKEKKIKKSLYNPPYP